MFQASIRLESISATAHARAWSRMRSASSVRRSGVTLLWNRIEADNSPPAGLSNTTAPATTGPEKRAASRFRQVPQLPVQPSVLARVAFITCRTKTSHRPRILAHGSRGTAHRCSSFENLGSRRATKRDDLQKKRPASATRCGPKTAN